MSLEHRITQLPNNQWELNKNSRPFVRCSNCFTFDMFGLVSYGLLSLACKFAIIFFALKKNKDKRSCTLICVCVCDNPWWWSKHRKTCIQGTISSKEMKTREAAKTENCIWKAGFQFCTHSYYYPCHYYNATCFRFVRENSSARGLSQTFTTSYPPLIY